MLFPAGSGLTLPPSPLLPTFHGCGFVPVHLLFPLFALEIKPGVVLSLFFPLFALQIRGKGAQPLSPCRSWCSWRGGMAQGCVERPCPRPSLPFPLGIPLPCSETLGSWAGQGRYKHKGVGFSLRVPRKENARDEGTPLQREPALRRPQSPWLWANRDSDKALFCGRTCCSSFPPVSGARSELPYPTDTVGI